MPYKIVPVTPLYQNCSIIWCQQSNKAAIVDPGGDPKQIQDAVEELGVEPEAILLTHGHLDHVGASEIIAQRYQIPIIGPSIEDKFWLDKLPAQCQMFGFPKISGFEPSRWLSDGDTVKVGDMELEVKHCPGHTPGHVVFINHQEQLAYVGDVLFKGGIGRTDFEQGNYEQLLNSINTQLLTLPNEYQFISGHGPMSTIGFEKSNNRFLL